MKVYIFLTTLFLTGVSCTIEPPINFVKHGTQTVEAILFLEQLRDTKSSQKLFNDHIERLGSVASVDFDWAEYWNQINEKELYKKLNRDQLYRVLQLSRLSCDNSSWFAFAELLLRISEEKGVNHLYFIKGHDCSLCMCPVLNGAC